MAKLNVIPDVGSPLTVVAVDLLAESFIPAQAEYADYVMTITGYLAGYMGWGGDFAKNIGIASLPLTARKIYDRVKGGTVTRMKTRLTNRAQITRSYQPEFESTAPHAF